LTLLYKRTISHVGLGEFGRRTREGEKEKGLSYTYPKRRRIWLNFTTEKKREREFGEVTPPPRQKRMHTSNKICLIHQICLH